MSVIQQLAEIVRDIATGQKAKASALKRELEEIEARKAQIETELDAANNALKRAASFPLQSGTDFPCPYCWMRGARSNVRAIGSDRKGEDHFRCNTCGEVTALPSGE